jgi:hypothetical protein
MSASFQFVSPFRASAGWVQGFKKKYQTEKHDEIYISSKDNASFKETIGVFSYLKTQLQ